MRTKIIYEDDALLVIYKPAGIATQTAKIGQVDVVSELKNYLSRQILKNSRTVDAEAKDKAKDRRKGNGPTGKSIYLGVVHRLDQPVEGLLVFGKTKEAAAKLSAQLEKGILNKQYYAVIGGQPSGKEGELVDKLYKSADNRAVVVTGQQVAEAKEAILQYRIVESLSLPAFSTETMISLADIHIETGRFHQIRAQMSYHGMALLGDSKYGDKETSQLSVQLGVRNVALCAYSLEVSHPVTRKKLSFEIQPEGKIFQGFRAFK